MKRVVTGMLAASLLVSGCTGTFQLTRKVYQFHRSQSDKWMDEILFLVVAILPVYSLATLADAVVFNSIEFWTGNNPIQSASEGRQEQRRTVRAGDQELVMSYAPTTDQIILTSAAGANGPTVVLERGPDGVSAKNAQGQLLFRSTTTPDGGIAVYDQDARLVKAYSADDVRRIASRELTQ